MAVRKSFWDYYWFMNFFFRAVGILPIGGQSTPWKTILTEVLAGCPLIYGSYVLIQPISYILSQNHNIDDLLEAVITALTIIGGQCRSFFVVVNRRKIARLFSTCSKLWDETTVADYHVISTWARRARLFSTTYFCAAQLVTVTFSATSTIRQLSLPENSTTSICAELEEVVRYINLTQVITGMYILAISATWIMKSVKSYRFYASFLLSLCGSFFSCWPADNLSFTSGELAKEVFALPWHRYSSRGKTEVAIMLARTQRPARLTAGKFVVLSLETFSSIVVNSISFSMILNEF